MEPEKVTPLSGVPGAATTREFRKYKFWEAQGKVSRELGSLTITEAPPPCTLTSLGGFHFQGLKLTVGTWPGL